MLAPITLFPLTFHCQAGDVPPLVGVAVNVNEVPAQTGFADGVIDTLTGKIGSTTMVNVFEVAGLPVAQSTFEVKIQDTASPFVGTKE